MYLHADPKLKEQALARTVGTSVRAPRYRPDDRVMAFLRSL
jgi:integrase/recombinase XerD